MFVEDEIATEDDRVVLVRVIALVLVLVCGIGVIHAQVPPAPPSPSPSPAPDAPATPMPNAPDPAPTPGPTPPPTPTEPAPMAPATTPAATKSQPTPEAPAPIAAPTKAQPAPTPPPGTAPTIVNGRVTDVLGRPVRDARVYVLPRHGKPYSTGTNKDGRYSVQVGTLGTHGVVIAIDKAHTFRSVIVKRGVTNSLDIEAGIDIEGGEVIKIEDKKRPLPAVPPKPLSDPGQALPYSDQAVERDAWARAWLLLDVDETGSVARLKMLKRPGFALEEICIVEAFKLRFAPALDAKGRPMKTYVLWKMEWPSWGWLVQGNGTAVHRPADHHEVHSYAQNIRRGVEGTELVRGVEVKIGGPWSRPLPAGTAFPVALSRVPCAGSGPLNLDLRNRAYRDCSPADMSVADALPWITRETVATAVTEMLAPDLALVVEKRGLSVPGIIGIGVTSALFVTTVVSYLKFDAAQQRVIDDGWKQSLYPEEVADHAASRNRWDKIAKVTAVAALLAGATTIIIIELHDPKRSFSVQPMVSSGSAGAQLTMSW